MSPKDPTWKLLAWSLFWLAVLGGLISVVVIFGSCSTAALGSTRVGVTGGRSDPVGDEGIPRESAALEVSWQPLAHLEQEALARELGESLRGATTAPPSGPEPPYEPEPTEPPESTYAKASWWSDSGFLDWLERILLLVLGAAGLRGTQAIQARRAGKEDTA